MKGIAWKIFIPVLVAMAGLILVSLLLLVNYGTRVQQNAQQLIPQLYEEAKDALLESGSTGLSKWLEQNQKVSGLRIFIVNRNEQDLLGRDLPPRHETFRDLKRNVRGVLPKPSVREQRKTGRYPVLRNGKKEWHKFIVARPAGGLVGVLKSQRMFVPILLSMILLSALVSALVARKISRPIQKLRAGVQKISQGQLAVKISPELSHRDDEIGDLANDFDIMTEKLSSLLANQQNLLRDVSHELRSPLARLQVALGLAEKRSAVEISPELQRIETEANTLNELIGSILSLVRLQNLAIDNTSLQFESINLVKMIQHLIENANYEAQEKSIAVEFDAPDSLFINAVPRLLGSAVENVLRNAVKYSPDNSKVICELRQAANSVCISILDSGTGVPDNELEKIFEPFYRVSKSREHQQGSGGIGLAIAKRAVELHSGTISASNTQEGLGVFIELSQ